MSSYSILFLSSWLTHLDWYLNNVCLHLVCLCRQRVVFNGQVGVSGGHFFHLSLQSVKLRKNHIRVVQQNPLLCICQQHDKNQNYHQWHYLSNSRLVSLSLTKIDWLRYILEFMAACTCKHIRFWTPIYIYMFGRNLLKNTHMQ